MTTNIDNIAEWFSELRDKGQAPDFEAQLELTLPKNFNLREQVRRIDKPEFHLIEMKDPDYDLYHCKDDYQRFLAKRHTACINTIDVFDDKIHFFRSNGGHSMIEYGTDEMKVFKFILSEPMIKVKKWRIYNSGDGLDGDMERSGTSQEDLLKYLASL